MTTAVDASNLNMTAPKEQNAAWLAAKPFVTGSMSGMIATTCIQPIDMVKVRIQLTPGSGPIQIASQMIKQDGFFSLYQGLSAGLTRQVVYTGARLGLFDLFTDKMRTPGQKMAFWQNAVCALGAGGTAAIIGNPADLALIRMQADSMLPAAERRGYKHVGDAFSSIVKTEGVGGLFQGAAPTATRAMALNFGMLAFNAQAKQVLEGAGFEKGSVPVVLGASAIAGFFASAFSLPFDYVKTQVQNMKPNAAGEMPYKGPIDCAMKTLKEGGPLRFYAGFPTFYVRIAPHAMITLMAQDKVKKMWKSMNL